MKTALTIAGSDPTGGAGFQVDLKIFKAFGLYGLSIPAVLTAQNTDGVYGIHELPSGFFREQVEILLNDMQPDAVKTGMLYSTDLINIIAEKIGGFSLKNIVVDPVAVSSTGVQLIEDRGLDIMKNVLFPLARVITPNIYEASVITGKEISSEKDIREAAVQLKDFGPEAVIITGGHMEDNAEDLLFDGDEFLSLEKEILDGEYHGTGCVFSSVIAACLALDYTLKEAFIKAKEFTYNAMRSAVSIGGGMNVLDL